MKSNPTAGAEAVVLYHWRSCKLGYGAACEKLIASIDRETTGADKTAVAKRLCMIFKNWDEPASEPHQKAACARYAELKNAPVVATPPPALAPEPAAKPAPKSTEATGAVAIADPLLPFPCPLPADKCAEHDKCLTGTSGAKCFVAGSNIQMALSSGPLKDERVALTIPYQKRGCALGSVDACIKVIDFETARPLKIAWAERACNMAKERYKDAGALGSKVDYACGALAKVKAPPVVKVLANEEVAATNALIAQRKKNLAGVDLSKKRLQEMDLSGVNLKGANLSGAVLTDAKLNGVDLREANLTGAVLTRANLGSSQLDRVKAAGANLSDANLEYSALSGADLEAANLESARCTGAVFEGAKLVKANLKYADLRSVDLHTAKLTGADFGGANVVSANFSALDLSGCNFQRTNAGGANFEKAKLDGCDLSDATFSKTNLRKASLVRVIAKKTTFMEATLDGANFESAKLTGASFDKYRKLGASFSGATDAPHD